MRWAALLGWLVLAAAPAHAHKPSDAYLSLRADGARLDGQWDIALRDLDDAIGLDADGDGAIAWGEVRGRRDAIIAFALPRLQIDADGGPCAIQPGALLADRHSDGAYAVLRFAVDCPRAPRAFGVRYGLLFDRDPQHRGILHFTAGGATRTRLFSADRPIQHLDVRATGIWHSVYEFWRDGVWHIWSGYDHVLFLLALLMPAVLRRTPAGWRTASMREAAVGTLKVVTAFTIAHSITLALAALGVVHLPARLVESGIAVSVAIAALNNAYPLFSDGRWLVGFGFGLLHGFGFASVLADPNLPASAVIVGLLGFNLGVETGQLVIVAAFLPAAYLVRHTRAYQRVTLVGGSFAIAGLATVWLLERALDIRVF